MQRQTHATTQGAGRAAFLPRRLGLPDLGFGIGLRSAHYRHILSHWPAVDWFELISENYLDCHGWRREVLRRIAERYPVVMHGVSLSIGSSDPLDVDYLRRLKSLALEIGARWISDHLCWTGVAGQNTHDLLPMPLNDSTLAHVVARVRTVQDLLGRPLVLENPSSYLSFQADSMPEWEFLARMAERAECGLLLDVNNVYVSSVNHDFDAQTYIDALPVERIVQIHIAGHRDCGTHIVDTHDAPVADPVWALYRHAVRRIGPVSTLLEWDARIPTFEAMHAEVLKAGRGHDRNRASPQPLPVGAAGDVSHVTLHDGGGAYPNLAGAEFERVNPIDAGFDLARLQSWLQDAVAVAGVRNDVAIASAHVRESAQLTAEARLAIYQVSYRARLLQSFHAIFPGLLQAMGQTLLDAFALDYLRERKPQHYSINRVADGFLAYLRRSRPVREFTEPVDWADFLIDLAALELALLDVSESRGLEQAGLVPTAHWRKLPHARLLQSQPQIAPCARLLHCAYPVHDYLHSLRSNQTPAPPPPRKVWLALTRNDYRLSTREVAAVQWELLCRLDGHTDLGRALEQVAELDLRPAPDVELACLWLDNFSAQGLLCREPA